jgi:hypothetical protein
LEFLEYFCKQFVCIHILIFFIFWQSDKFFHKFSWVFGKPECTYTKKKKPSGVDNWYLDEFFEEFICGRWYIYLEQTIYHLCRPISSWSSSLAVEYHLLRMIISYVVWYSSPADDIQLKQMILIWRGWYWSRADNIQLKQMICTIGPTEARV